MSINFFKKSQVKYMQFKTKKNSWLSNQVSNLESFIINRFQFPSSIFVQKLCFIGTVRPQCQNIMRFPDFDRLNLKNPVKFLNKI